MDEAFKQSTLQEQEEKETVIKEERNNEPAPKYIVENGIPYVLVGDYYIPDLRAEEAEPAKIGRFGRARLNFLKENRPEEVNRLILEGNINETLKELNERTEDRITELVQELLRTNPAPDKMKQQIQWVGHMNMLREQAIEIAMNEMIYV